MDNDLEMTRLHRLTQDEADLIHGYRILGDDFTVFVRSLVENLLMDKSAKAATSTNSNVVKFPG